MTNVPFPFSLYSPSAAPRSFQWQMDIPGDIRWDKISQVYTSALQPAYQELWLSSARIIQ